MYKILSYSMLCVLFANANSHAADGTFSVMDPSIVKKELETAPISQDVQLKKDVLSSLYDAQVSLHNENNLKADKHVQAALRLLERITHTDHDINPLVDAFDEKVYDGHKVVELSFGSLFKPERAVMPMKEKMLSKSDIDVMLDITKLKSGSLDEAEIRYIAFDIEKPDTRSELIEARKAIADGDLYSAMYDLLQVQRDMLEDNPLSVPARIRARDHIALTRFMIEKEEGKAAIHALEIADNALSEMREGTDDLAGLKSIEREISDLRKRVQQIHPNG